MKFDKQNLLLYAVTDRSWLGEKTLFQQVEEALQGGVTMLQLREKDLDEKSFMEEACLLYTSTILPGSICLLQHPFH